MIHFKTFYSVILPLDRDINVDMESHNILLLMEYLGDPSPMTDIHLLADPSTLFDTDSLYAVGIIRSYLDNGFLRSSFTPRELLGPVSSIVEHLSQKLNLFLKKPDSLLSYFGNLVSMVVHLADLENEVNGASKAVQVFTAEEHIIVAMEQFQSSLLSYCIVMFYRELSHYYLLLEEHDKVKECHEKILRRNRALLAECEPGKCQYKDIGMAYFDLRDYASNVQFFQLALDLESENMTVMARIKMMAHLYLISYYIINDTVKAENVLENLTVLLPVVEAKPEAEVYQFRRVLKTLIEIYQLNSRFEEVRHLKDKLIKAVRQVGAKPTEDTMRTAQELAVYLFKEANDYPNAADLAEFALQSFTHLSNKDQLKMELAQIQVTVGMAKFMNWNFSEGLDYMELAADCICENIQWTQPSFIDWQITLCFALRGHLCPLQNILKTNILPYAVWIIGVLFEVLVDMNTVANCPFQQFVDHLLPFSVVHSFTSWLSARISTSVPFLHSLFVINVMYVMEKLFLISCLAYFLWCYIASIVDYCRVFMKSVLNVVILYAVHMSHPFIIYVLSSAFIPWLFLSMSAYLLFVSITWFEINALLYVMALIILISFYLLWYCITKVMHYCKVFVHLCDSVLSCVNPIAIWFVLYSTVFVSASLLLSGVPCGIFEVTILHLVLALVIKIILLLYIYKHFCIFCYLTRVYYSHYYMYQ